MDERKVKGQYILGILVAIDCEIERHLKEYLRQLGKKYKAFSFHATDDTAPTSLNMTKSAAAEFKKYIESEISEFCDGNRLIFLRAITPHEFESYSEIMKKLERLAFEHQLDFEIHRDEGNLEKKTWSKLKPWLAHLGWKMQPHPKKSAPHLIGVVDYALFYKLAMTPKQKK